MATERSNEIAALYPPPPPYIKYFTEENVQKMSRVTSEGEKREAEGVEGDLSYLVPPSIPESGHYRAFGSIWHIKDELPDLIKSGMTQLYDSEQAGASSSYQDRIKELHRLLKSLLLNFLELTGILSINPEKFPEKVDHIRTILINIHHLLNEYRPHQSRESLIMLLEEQLEYKKREIREIKSVCDNVRSQLDKLLPNSAPATQGQDQENQRDAMGL
ncbi:LAMI_0G06832g1_1 [Lachancea mirantina]|uniref:Mediator of RNA polymerase II transcription subunit 7 n=1 Tax=Lachancea mirantina TaxID=1230905 RepID=A0A1G4K9A7_9SACH|nr:LAMI_0G06832g1_1 [Lachancea mirantina]